MPKAKVGHNTGWGFKKEASWGTVATVDQWIAIQSESISQEYDIIELSLTDDRFQNEFRGDAGKALYHKSAGGDISFLPDGVQVGYVLAFAMGAEHLGNTVLATGGDTTLSAAASAGATSISVGSITNIGTSDYLVLSPFTADAEVVKVTGAATGTGPYTLPVTALANAHASGAAVKETESTGGTTAAVVHRFLNSGTLPSFTSNFPVNGDHTKQKQAVGCMVDSLSLDFAEDLFSASVSVKSKNADLVDVTAAPDFTTAQRPWTYADCAMTLPGITQAQVVSGSLQLSNGLIDDDYRQGSVELAGLYPGIMSVEGSFDVVYDPGAASAFDTWIDGGSSGAIEVAYSGNALWSNSDSVFKLRAVLPRSVVTGASPQVSAGEKIMQTVNFRHFYDPAQANAHERTVYLELTNTLQTKY